MPYNAAGNELEIQKDCAHSPILHYFRTRKIVNNRRSFKVLSVCTEFFFKKSMSKKLFIPSRRIKCKCKSIMLCF